MWQEQENNSDEGSEDEVEELQDLRRDFKPTFVVIAIDNHPLMFKKTEDGSSRFKDCLSACYSLADSLLLTTSKRSWNQFAVLIANEESPCLTEFRDNLIDTVKLLKTKAAMPNKQLAEEYQRKGDFDLAAFFLACKKVFHDIKTPFYKRSLIYITDDDNPVQDATKKFTALNEVKTFAGNQIDFQIIPTTKDFDYSKFYNELFSLLNNLHVEENCEDKEGLIEKLTSTVIMRHMHRKIMFYPFKGDTSHFLNCYKFDFVHTAKLNNSMLTKDGKSVKLTTENLNEFVDDVYYFQCCKGPGRDGIKFDSYEKSCIFDNSLPPGLSLLYVSKRITGVGDILGKPFFLRSKKEEDVYFNKFWQCCTENGRVLVCALKQKAMGNIRYTELIPTTVNNIPAFLVKFIPHTTEIIGPRKMDYPEIESDDKKKEAIRKVVDALTFDFDVKMIPDPCFRKKKEYIKAKLLEEPVEEVNDEIFNTKALDELLKEAVDMVNDNFTLVAERKRKAASGSTKRSSKQTKL